MKTKILVGMGLLLLVIAGIFLVVYTKSEAPRALPILQDKPFIYVEPSEITKESTIRAFLSAEADIAELKGQNFTTFYVNDLLYQAQRFYVGHQPQLLQEDAKQLQGDKKEYINTLVGVSNRIPPYEVEQQNLSSAERYVQQIAYTKKRVYDISDSITILEQELVASKKRKADTTQAEAMLGRAKEEFSKERYDDAVALLRETVTRLQEAQSESARVKNLFILSKGFIERNWGAILIVIAIILALIVPAVNAVQRIIAKKKVVDLKEELKTMQSLVIRAQEDCFKYKRITPETYKILEGKYRSRIAEIKQQIPINQAIAEGKIQKKKKGDEELREELKKTQLKI